MNNVMVLRSQDVIMINPLFEYPVAPEELVTMSDKCDYLVEHFWDPFDFKLKNAVDQNALNHAFNVYITSVAYATPQKSNQELDKLIDKISKNPILLTQFVKAAEENLYGPRADYWNDNLYMKFLETVNKNKKISEQRRNYYKKQYQILQASQIGKKMPGFTFNDNEDIQRNYFPMSTPTLIIFGDPSDPDWRSARLKMETNFDLSQAVDKGKANIIYIVNKKNKDWKDDVANYPVKWIVGENENVNSTIDIRIVPSIYVIGTDGNIKEKNISLSLAIATLLEEVKGL